MAITSELIGKLGGSDVDQTPVEVTASGGRGSEGLLHTVEVPEGQTWLVILHGNLQSFVNDTNSSAHLYIGDTVHNGNATNGITGLAHVGTGTIEVGLRRNYANQSDSFTGHLYTVKL